MQARASDLQSCCQGADAVRSTASAGYDGKMIAFGSLRSARSIKDNATPADANHR
jgi:hypothetical protein